MANAWMWSCGLTALWAVSAVADEPRSMDLELRPGGVLTGQVFNSAGAPVAGAGRIAVVRNGRELAFAQVSPEGRFELRGLTAGPSELRLLTVSQPCRLWSPGTAPPKTPRQVLLVTGRLTQRGQQRIGALLRNPIVIGLGVAGAVAIPLSVHDRSGS